MAVRVSQQGAEVLHTGTPAARISQVGVEVAHTGTPKARISQVGVEVLYTPGSTSTRTVSVTAAVVRRRTIPLSARLLYVLVGLLPSSGSIVHTPVLYEWRSIPEGAGHAVHFRLQVIAQSGSFSSPLVNQHSYFSPGFEYDTSAASDGSGPWQAIDLSGLALGNQGRLVRVTLETPTGDDRWRVTQESLLT